MIGISSQFVGYSKNNKSQWKHTANKIRTELNSNM